MAELKVTQVKSKIGIKPKQRGTLRALGLRRINHTVVLPDRPEIRGMVAKVPHLVTVTEVSESDAGTLRRRSPGLRGQNGEEEVA
jgi:large subunit ribosomal protein L30